MMIRKLFRTAWKYKSQFISMIIMVTIGVGIFLGFNIEWKSIEADTSSFFEATNYADFRLYAQTGFSEEDIEAIREIEGVDAATRYFSVNVDLKDSQKSVCLNVSESYNVSTMLVMKGMAYDGTCDGVWLSDRFAEENGLDIGDTLCMVFDGREVSREIVGLIKSGEMMICTPDENQLMPDYTSFGFAYVTPKTLEQVMGMAFYPQINIRADLEKAQLEQAVAEALGRTTLTLSKEEHVSYAGALSETEEGQTMGSILPVLFLMIAILTMVTTMHRITANEKTQIGTLKALGFRDKRILRHYTSYGFVIGLVGTVLGIVLGYGIASLIISRNGMMSTYFDLPDWSLVMPGFCWPLLGLIILLLTLISFLSVRQMLKGTAADALRPYVPKAMKKIILERISLWNGLSFGTRWNLRDVLRHKSRSAMTLIGVIGCMILLVGGFGMKDTMAEYLRLLDEDICNYTTRINLSDTASKEEALTLAGKVDGDWLASCGISYEGKTVTLEIYSAEHGWIGFVDGNNDPMTVADDGVYLCQRLKDTAKIGDIIEFSPYGSEETYQVKVAGYYRSVITESIVITDTCADRLGITYHISAIFTDRKANDIEVSSIVAGKQDKQTMMESYDSFLDIMNMMVLLLVVAAIVLGIVVLYNLGVMSYLERSRELATLKVLGFRDRHVGRLLVSQNLWLTVVGVLIGAPGGVGTLYGLIKALATEYELKLTVGLFTYAVSILLTFGTSLLVGWMVAGKNRKIDMVEALKGAE